MAVERHTRAMGTDVEVIVVGDTDAEALADAAIARIELLERRWSRFRDDSEVSRMNRAAAAGDPRPVPVSPDTTLLVQRAVDAYRLSWGLVDCTELESVIDAGYDRSFELMPSDRRSDVVGNDLPGGRRNERAVLAAPTDIIVAGHRVALPPGVGFDPGGIGKGLAADIVTHAVMLAGAAGTCVNIGGDLRVRGEGPNGAWTISIDHPDGSTVDRVGIRDGGIASSTTLRRAWRIDGEPRHHLIDPRTGKPAESDLTFASAIAAEAWQAETLAKAVLLRGGTGTFGTVDGTGSAALAVRFDGRVSTSADWSRFSATPPGRHAPIVGRDHAHPMARPTSLRRQEERP